MNKTIKTLCMTSVFALATNAALAADLPKCSAPEIQTTLTQVTIREPYDQRLKARLNMFADSDAEMNDVTSVVQKIEDGWVSAFTWSAFRQLEEGDGKKLCAAELTMDSEKFKKAYEDLAPGMGTAMAFQYQV